MPTPCARIRTAPGRLASTPNALAASEFLSRRRRRPLEFAAGLASSMARPHPELLTMPLDFSDAEMTLLLALAQPIEPAQRSAFLDAVAAAIGEQASGPGLVHQTGRRVQRDFWTPPQLSPNARHPCLATAPPEGLGARLKGEFQSWNTRARPRFIARRASWLIQSKGPPTKASMGARGCSCCQCSGHLVVASVPT
jgi:hypothetical protein